MPNRRDAARARRAFTLIELLVVIAIISTLIALTLPSLAGARQAARGVKCMVNVRSISQGLTLYGDTNSDTFPYWSAWQTWNGDGTGGDSPGRGWTELLGDFLETPEVHHDPARPKDFAPFSYFLQSRYTFSRSNRLFTSLRQPEIFYPSAFVLAGDCNNPNQFAQPYGSISLPPNCDVDDATEPAVFFTDELMPHNRVTNLAFSDGHVAQFRRYQRTEMTWHGTKMVDWTLIE